MKDSTKKQLTKISKKILVMLLISFTAIYISEKTGYFEFQQHSKKTMTELQIKKFEQDVKSGKNIDIDEYINYDKKDYSSPVSKIGDNIGKNVSNIVTSGLDMTFKFINKMMG